MVDGKHASEREYLKLETRAVTFYVFRISKHARFAYILLVLAPVFFPLCHVIKSSGKLFASKPFYDLFAAVTDNFNLFDSRVRRGFNGHPLSPFLATLTVNRVAGLAYFGVKKHGVAFDCLPLMRDYPCPGPLLLRSPCIAEPIAITTRSLRGRRSMKLARLCY